MPAEGGLEGGLEGGGRRAEGRGQRAEGDRPSAASMASAPRSTSVAVIWHPRWSMVRRWTIAVVMAGSGARRRSPARPGESAVRRLGHGRGDAHRPGNQCPASGGGPGVATADTFARAADANTAIAAWVDRYNAVRLHSTIGYVPPVEWGLRDRLDQRAAQPRVRLAGGSPVLGSGGAATPCLPGERRDGWPGPADAASCSSGHPYLVKGRRRGQPRRGHRRTGRGPVGGGPPGTARHAPRGRGRPAGRTGR